MEYEISVVNNGTYTATGVVLTDTWGAYTEYSDFNHDYYGWITPTLGAEYVTRTLELGVGASEQFVFRVTVTDTASFYTNTVNLTSDQTTEQTDTATVWGGSIATTKSATPVPRRSPAAS